MYICKYLKLILSKDVKHLLKGLLEKDPSQRIGYNRGMLEII